MKFSFAVILVIAAVARKTPAQYTGTGKIIRDTGIDNQRRTPYDSRNSAKDSERTKQTRPRIFQVEKEKFPHCINITVQRQEFNLKHDNIEFNMGRQSVTFSEFEMPEDNSSATLCYPLSPQLLTCKRQVYDVPVTPLIIPLHVKDHSLLIIGTDFVFKLGDYFLSDDGSAIVCDEKINQKLSSIPRCNYVNISTNEFDVLANGSWQFKTSRQILDRPELLVQPENKMANGTYNVCMPLSINLLNCMFLETLFPSMYFVAENHSLFTKVRGTYLDTSEYFISEDSFATVCYYDRYNNYKNYVSTTIVVPCFALSSFCLLTTVLYQWFSSPNPSYHTKCMIFHLLSLVLANIFGAVDDWEPQPPLDLNPAGCYSVFILTYLGYMWSFTWLNVMAFDVWYSFNNLQTSKSSCATYFTAAQRFHFYNIYAWLLPLILCGVLIITDQYRSVQKAFWMYPDIGCNCWFHDVNSEWLFHHGPVVLILSSNILFFVGTMRTLKCASKGTELVRREKNKQRFIVCFKLFVIMGLVWIVQIVMWSADYYETTIGIFSDGVTGLQGIAIFIIYMCNRTTYEKVRQGVPGKFCFKC